MRVSLPTILCLASAATLSVALMAQYGFDLYPCELCIQQRYPYVGVIVLAAVAMALPCYRAYLLWGCAAFFLAGAGLAIEHVGVEQDWWESASGCTAHTNAGATLDELRAMIAASPLVSCSDPAAVILGLSLAAWNAIVAMSLAGLTLYHLLKKIHANQN
jgi:disulfide bond formation protein DsbB